MLSLENEKKGFLIIENFNLLMVVIIHFFIGNTMNSQ